MDSKAMTMREAVRGTVKPGDTVFFAGMQHGNLILEE
jgi:hypothetical protein